MRELIQGLKGPKAPTKAALKETTTRWGSR